MPRVAVAALDDLGADQVVLDAAAQLRHDVSLAEMHAIALHGTIIELLSACVLLAQSGQPTGIPILLRSEYVGGNERAATLRKQIVDDCLYIWSGGPKRRTVRMRRRPTSRA